MIPRTRGPPQLWGKRECVREIVFYSEVKAMRDKLFTFVGDPLRHTDSGESKRPQSAKYVKND